MNLLRGRATFFCRPESDLISPEELAKVYSNWSPEDRERFLSALPHNLAFCVVKETWYMYPKGVDNESLERPQVDVDVLLRPSGGLHLGDYFGGELD